MGQENKINTTKKKISFILAYCWVIFYPILNSSRHVVNNILSHRKNKIFPRNLNLNKESSKIIENTACHAWVNMRERSWSDLEKTLGKLHGDIEFVEQQVWALSYVHGLAQIMKYDYVNNYFVKSYKKIYRYLCDENEIYLRLRSHIDDLNWGIICDAPLIVSVLRILRLLEQN